MTIRWKHLLNALRAFEAAARHGSMTAASVELNVTLGAISQHVKLLEQSLGLVLMLRQHRRLDLTEAGRRLQASLSTAFLDIERTLESITEPPESPRLRLRVMPTFAIRWLVPRLTSFYQQHPEIDIELGTFQKQEDVRLEDADFIVRNGDGLWKDGVCELIFQDALTPACSPAVARSLQSPEDLVHHTFLHSMMREGGWSSWLSSAGLPGLRPARSIQLANAAVSYQAAIDGLGVALAQTAYIRDDLASGKLVLPFACTHHPGSGYYLVYEQRKLSQSNISAFRAWMASLPEKEAESTG